MTALDAKRMQTFFNEFIVTTVTFLNKFSSVSESKLINLERKLTRIEASIILIEEKLSEVSKGADSLAQQLEILTVPQQEAANISNTTKVDDDHRVRIDDLSQSSQQSTVAAEKSTETSISAPKDESGEPTKAMIRISQVPLFRKYFMMLKVGVPMSAVQQKMASEGIEVDLSNPDRLIEDTFTTTEETEE